MRGWRSSTIRQTVRHPQTDRVSAIAGANRASFAGTNRGGWAMHSYAEQMHVTCPQCGHGFDADVWLIVDAGEHPDLVARIRDGRVHEMTCPRCGESLGQANAPLLVFRPDMEPHILFSPTPRATARQVGKQASRLVGLLQEQMGREWQDEWIAGSVPWSEPTHAGCRAGGATGITSGIARTEQDGRYAPADRAVRTRAGSGDARRQYLPLGGAPAGIGQQPEAEPSGRQGGEPGGGTPSL